MKIKIEKKYSATVLVDAQNGFTPVCPNELPVPDGDKIVDECLKTFEKTEYKIASKDAHSRTAHWITEWKGDIAKAMPLKLPQMDLFWPRHCEVGTTGFELIAGLPPIEEFDFIVYKGAEKHIHPYSAVYHLLTPNSKGNRISTGMIEFLQSQCVDVVVIVGLATNYCCMATAMDLAQFGFRVVFNLAGCRGIGDVNPAIETMKAAGIEFVENSDEISIE